MKSIISIDGIADKIYFIRGLKVMFDRDLAELYGIETKRLKEQVRRNIERFPEDFMFELTKEELKNWRSQFATSNQYIMGLRIPPFAFTEHGVLMLSSVLKSDLAVQVNIQIMRVFTKLRQMVLDNEDLAQLYGVETKILNKAVKRNLDRFPEDFMFQLTAEESKNLRFQIGTSKQRGGRRYLPYAFTEQGGFKD